MKRYTVIDTDCEADVWFDNVENKPLDYKDIEKILEKQGSQWQKLKAYIKNTNHSIGTLRDVNDILDKMQELEGKDDE